MENIDESVYQRAILVLGYRDHSVQELRRKLLTKGFEEEAIEAVLVYLLKKKYLDDDNFSQQYCQYRFEKGYGRLKIRYELQQRGVAVPLIQSALQNYADEWYTSAQKVHQQRFGDKPKNQQQKNKQIRFLQNRGFEWEEINACFR